MKSRTPAGQLAGEYTQYTASQITNSRMLGEARDRQFAPQRSLAMELDTRGPPNPTSLRPHQIHAGLGFEHPSAQLSPRGPLS